MLAESLANMLRLPQAASTSQGGAVGYLAILANLVKVVEGVGILVGLTQLWLSRAERRDAEARSAALARKAANYQAWQVVNSAHGKGGSGGRIDALQDLVANDVSLAGVNLDGAWLEKVVLKGAALRSATFRGTRLIGADLSGTSLEGADLENVDLSGASLHGAFLKGANLAGASLGAADLRDTDLQDVVGWERITSISYCSIAGIRHAPPGFVQWARDHGALDDGDGDAAVEPSTASYSQQFRSI